MNTNLYSVCPTNSLAGDKESFAGEPDFGAPAPDAFFQHAPDAATGTVPYKRRKRRILLVDDDNQVLTSVALVLEQEGYDVSLAGDGYEAMMKCHSRHPDLVLIDLNMPRLDGWQTIEAIDRLAPLVPIIIITAKPEQYERAVGVGVDAFMEKPLDFPLLLEAVARLLSESTTEHVGRITNRKFETLRLGSNRGQSQ